MGRDAGHIALAAGIAGGADVILIPEIPYVIEKVAQRRSKALREMGRNHALVVVTESVKTESGESIGVKDESGNVRYGGSRPLLGRAHRRTYRRHRRASPCLATFSGVARRRRATA